MLRRVVVVLALILAIVTATAVTPRRVEATDNLVYIIPAAVGGVVIVVLVVAILMANRTKEPELELAASRAPAAEPRDGVRLAFDCPASPGGFSLLCW